MKNHNTCPECGYCAVDIDFRPSTGSIRPLEYTEYVKLGRMHLLRAGLPDSHAESIPSLYYEKYKEFMPKDWRDDLP